ncbi:MAG: LacI family DNA-binding transcriptional regulator [Eubacteriales bacterium]|nr:LacI family DNA-binding transcriptional regulator [Eubacteriales bacterium]
MAYTIKDIAKEAGVSTATVSKVINNKMYVAPGTRSKVLQVMKRLNYTPNVSAANLARKSSKMILYADHFYKGLPYENPHMFDIICGVSHELSRKGFHLSLLNLDSSGKQTSAILEDAIRSRIADGIIINGTMVSPQVEKTILRQDFPQICIGAPDFDSILSWIDTNHTLSSSLAVDHLISCGCRRIAFMGGRKEDKIFMDRLKGFRIAMEKHGLEIPETYITYNEPNIESIVHSATELLQQSEAPDSIICTNSLMTVGTMQAIKEAGLSIPNEISLIAFDDHPYTPMLSPAPTVIDIDLFNLGVHAGNLLLKKVKDPAMLIQTYTALPRLVQRATTRPLND